MRLSLSLTLLWLLGTGVAGAGEWGVHWETARPADPADATWETRLSAADVTWRRSGPRPAGIGAAAPTSVVWWPGATPFRPADTPDLTQWRLNLDLWTVFRTAQTKSPAGPGTVAAVEVGNEPDLHFTPDLPDRMAATLKAAWWGLKSGRPDLPVLLPAAAAAPGPYFEQLLANGAGAFTDGWNFHFYGWAHDFAPSVASQRRFLARHGLAGLPLWLTEYGFADLPAGSLAENPTLLGRQQAFFERTTAEGAWLGVHRQLAFCFHPHQEGGLDFSLRTPAGEPRPALTAWLNLTRQLRSARPRFRIEHRELGQTVGWVWELPAAGAEPARWWTMLFTPHRRAEFDLPERPGCAAAQSAPGVSPVSFFEFQLRFPAAVRPVRVGLNGEHGDWPEATLHFNATSSTNLHLLTAPGQFEVAGCRWEPVRAVREPAPPRPRPSPVVVTLRPLGPGWVPDKARLAYRHGNALPLELELRLHNFGPARQAGRWTLEVPTGWRLLDGPLHGCAQLEALTDEAIRVWARPPAGGGPNPKSFRLRWQGEDRRSDVAQIQVCPAGLATGPMRAISGWQVTGGGEAEREDGAGTVRFRRPASALGEGLALVLPLPADVGLDSNSLLRFRFRVTSPWSQRRRLSLITPARETFRHDEDLLVRDGWQTEEVRVGDFTPAFWSRVGPGDPARAGYVGLAITRLRAGDSVEVSDLQVLQPE